MIAKQRPPARRLARSQAGFEAGTLAQAAANEEDDHREQRADQEGQAPPPFLERGLGQGRLKYQQQCQRDQLPRDQRDILKARPEAAPLPTRHLA
jgi:hypothetical protein